MDKLKLGTAEFGQQLVAFLRELPPEEKKKMRDALLGWADSGIVSWQEYYKTLDKENK